MNVSRFDPQPHSFEFNAAPGSPRYTPADRGPEMNQIEKEARLDASAAAVARELAIYQAAFRVNNGAMQVLGPVD